MGEKFEALYTVCLNKKNINMIIEVICDDVRLSERSIPKCVLMAQNIMKKNISNLSRPPKNKEEFKELVKYLNKLCVNSIFEIIVKKYPNLHINKKRHVSKEQLKRELEISGNRPNYVQDRPYDIRSKRRNDDEDDDEIYNMRINDTGNVAAADIGGYAPAFSDMTVTNIPIGQKQHAPTNRGSGSAIERRYQDMLASRTSSYQMHERPPTPDFTIDGTGEKIRMQKMMRKMEDQQFQGMSNGMPNGMGMDDPYASLLSPGAPMQSPLLNSGGPMQSMNSPYMNVNNNYMDNHSEKMSLLQSDLERKLAERKQVDIETQQPSTNPNYAQMNMPIQNNQMQMPMSNMPMQNMPMSNMPMSNMMSYQMMM